MSSARKPRGRSATSRAATPAAGKKPRQAEPSVRADRQVPPGVLPEPGLPDLVDRLAGIMRQHDLTEVVIDQQHLTLRLSRGAAAAPTDRPARPLDPPPPPAPVLAPASTHATVAVDAAPAAHAHGHPHPRPPVEPSSPLLYITSPFVGTFYRSPSPEAPAFVDVGSKVRKGQVLCIVEAMKLMNEIESDVDGTIVAIMAENGQPVEFGEPLFQMRP
jgi:acetyl-CoA carboxylase biotin carboxyl carrier protein